MKYTTSDNKPVSKNIHCALSIHWIETVQKNGRAPPVCGGFYWALLFVTHTRQHKYFTIHKHTYIFNFVLCEVIFTEIHANMYTFTFTSVNTFKSYMQRDMYAFVDPFLHVKQVLHVFGHLTFVTSFLFTDLCPIRTTGAFSNYTSRRHYFLTWQSSHNYLASTSVKQETIRWRTAAWLQPAGDRTRSRFNIGFLVVISRRVCCACLLNGITYTTVC